VTFPEGSLGNILRAMDHATRVDIPVANIQYTAPSKDSPTFRKGSEEWKLHPEVERRKRDILIKKNLTGSFTGTELEKRLREQGIERVAIYGYMTQMCGDTSATPGIPSGPPGGLSFRCDRDVIRAKQCRFHLGLRPAQCRADDNGGEVFEGGRDGGMDQRKNNMMNAWTMKEDVSIHSSRCSAPRRSIPIKAKIKKIVDLLLGPKEDRKRGNDSEFEVVGPL
jgi:hypothetical protein